ncbi:hypothetical protein JCM31598_03790 [Desulfonatronum parangueonense]
MSWQHFGWLRPIRVAVTYAMPHCRQMDLNKRLNPVAVILKGHYVKVEYVARIYRHASYYQHIMILIPSGAWARRDWTPDPR